MAVPGAAVLAAEPTADETAPLTAVQSAMQSVKASALMGVVSRLKENAANNLKEAKPWGEVFDKTAFGKPANAAEATGRLRKNVAYFKVNYMITTVGITSLVLFMNPWSIFVLAFLALVWFYFYIIKTTPVVIGGRELSEREKFISLAAISLITIFFLTSVGSVIFYALGLSCLLVAAHGVFRVPDDLFLDEPQANTGGFLSILTGAAAPAAPATATAV